MTEVILLSLLRVITQSAFLRVHLPEARVRVYLLLMKKVLPIHEVMKIAPKQYWIWQKGR
ncbi:porin [Escherichia coli]